MAETSQEDTTLLCMVIMAFIFFSFLLPKVEEGFNNDKKRYKEKMTVIDPIKNSEGINKFDTKKCSKDCCLHTQWPIPHLEKKDMNSKDSKNSLIGSNFMCANGNGGGCLCLNKEDLTYLGERGKNRKSCKE